MVLDQVGDNDPAASAALGQAVSEETVRALEGALRSRGYDVDLSAGWNGIAAQDGSMLVSRDDLGWLANGVLQFANSPDGGGAGVMDAPRFVAPELAAKVGWATQSDALLYINLKGVSVSDGKRTAQVLGVVFFVVIVAALIAALVATNSKNVGGNGSPDFHPGGGGWRGSPVIRGTPPVTALRPPAPLRGLPPGGVVVAPPRGRGMLPPRPPGAGRVYVGGPRVDVGVNVFVPIVPVVPLDGPMYTHDGTVTHEDETFAGDELYVSMTLLSAHDGRVLWHSRTNLDLDAQDPRDIDQMVGAFLDTVPPRAGVAAAPAR